MRPGTIPPYRPAPERRTEETSEDPLAAGLSSWSRRYRILRRRSTLLMWVALGAMSLLLVLCSGEHMAAMSSNLPQRKWMRRSQRLSTPNCRTRSN